MVQWTRKQFVHVRTFFPPYPLNMKVCARLHNSWSNHLHDFDFPLRVFSRIVNCIPNAYRMITRHAQKPIWVTEMNGCSQPDSPGEERYT